MTELAVSADGRFLAGEVDNGIPGVVTPEDVTTVVIDLADRAVLGAPIVGTFGGFLDDGGIVIGGRARRMDELSRPLGPELGSTFGIISGDGRWVASSSADSGVLIEDLANGTSHGLADAL